MKHFIQKRLYYFCKLFSTHFYFLIWKYKETIVTSVTIEMNSLEFMKVLFLKVLQLCKPTCASQTCCCFCEPQRKLRDRTHCTWWKMFVTIFRQAVLVPQLCKTLKTHDMYTIASSNNARFEQGTLQSVCFRIAVLFILVLIWFSPVK